MEKRSIYQRYVPSLSASNWPPPASAWLFAFSSAKMLVKSVPAAPEIPTGRDLAGLDAAASFRQYLGDLAGRPCYCLELDEAFAPPPGMQFIDLRSVLGLVDEDIFLLAGRACQVVNWNRMHKFCGKCGALTEAQQHELAKKCPQCGSLFFPRISPAIIVAVVRGEEILLAHNKNFRPNWYSVIAGFVEPGETFEDCVARELMEEVGIRVKNIRYFDSQPWPFPDSLMVGFIAEHADGEIMVDGEEIEDAAWYGRDNLPPRPGPHSIAGRLIETVISRW